MLKIKKYLKLDYEIIATPEEAYLEVLDENENAIMEVHKNQENDMNLIIYKTENISMPISELERISNTAKEKLNV